MKSLLIGCFGLIAAVVPALGQVEPVAPAVDPVSAAGKTKVVWLLLVGYRFNASIPTATIEQCELAGAEFMASKRFNINYRKFECLEGIR